MAAILKPKTTTFTSNDMNINILYDFYTSKNVLLMQKSVFIRALGAKIRQCMQKIAAILKFKMAAFKMLGKNGINTAVVKKGIKIEKTLVSLMWQKPPQITNNLHNPMEYDFKGFGLVTSFPN